MVSVKIHGSGEQIAQKISREIKDELGVTVSIGIYWNKIFENMDRITRNQMQSQSSP